MIPVVWKTRAKECGVEITSQDKDYRDVYNKIKEKAKGGNIQALKTVLQGKTIADGQQVILHQAIKRELRVDLEEARRLVRLIV